MAAFPALTRLPPAGERIALRPLPRTRDPFDRPDPYMACLVDSGTSALALALLAVRRQRADVAVPNVVVPGYGCPDLVSAAVFAGYQVKLVDLEPGSFRMAPAGVANAVDAHTLAVMAPHFLGLRERMSDLAALCREHGLALIEDSAQLFPPSWARLRGDLVVFSFGRGKPVSLLGGGALLASSAGPFELQCPDAADESTLRWLLKAFAYNVLRHPALYRLLPLRQLGVGATRYRPLAAIHGLSTVRKARVGRNVGLQATATAERRAACISEYQQRLSGLPVRFMHRDDEVTEMTRLPLLLADGPQRDIALAQLQQHGCGATSMYGSVLHKIQDIPRDAFAGVPALPCASDFAARLLTLPVHSQVRPAHIRRVRETLEPALNAGTAVTRKVP